MFPEIPIRLTTSKSACPTIMASLAVLYRRVLRLHRQKLPAVQRSIGDEYVKKEFRAHQSLPEDSEFHAPFAKAWDDYCVQLEAFAVEGSKGWSEGIRNRCVWARKCRPKK